MKYFLYFGPTSWSKVYNILNLDRFPEWGLPAVESLDCCQTMEIWRPVVVRLTEPVRLCSEAESQ